MFTLAPLGTKLPRHPMPILQVKVKPNAKRQSIEHTDAGLWIVHLQSPPVDGKANQELIQVLSKTFKVAKSKIQIKSGASARLKLIEIDADVTL